MTPDKLKQISRDIDFYWTHYVDEETSDAAFRAIEAINDLAKLVARY